MMLNGGFKIMSPLRGLQLDQVNPISRDPGIISFNDWQGELESLPKLLDESPRTKGISFLKESVIIASSIVHWIFLKLWIILAFPIYFVNFLGNLDNKVTTS